MKINIETYELYVIDYLEGALSEELKAAFDVFLDLHPEIKDELSEIATLELEANLEINIDKKLIERDLFSDENIEIHFEDLCIDSIENQLSKIEKLKFEAFLDKNYSKKTVFEQFQKTILSKKNNLKSEDFKFLLKQLILDEQAFTEELSIAHLEGDLTKNECQLFEELLITNADLLQKSNLYKHLKLKPNKLIYFDKKQNLYKKESFHFVFSRKFALAASILLFAFLLLPKIMKFDNRMASKIGVFNESLTSKEAINRTNNEIVAISEQIETKYLNNTITKKNINNKKQPYEDTIEKKQIETFVMTENKETYLTTNTIIPTIEIGISIKSEQFKQKTDSQILAISEPINEKQSSKNQIPKIKFWKAASFAVTVFSKATDSNILLTSEYDENGNLMALDIVSEKFNYSKNYKR